MEYKKNKKISIELKYIIISSFLFIIFIVFTSIIIHENIKLKNENKRIKIYNMYNPNEEESIVDQSLTDSNNNEYHSIDLDSIDMNYEFTEMEHETLAFGNDGLFDELKHDWYNEEITSKLSNNILTINYTYEEKNNKLVIDDIKIKKVLLYNPICSPEVTKIDVLDENGNFYVYYPNLDFSSFTKTKLNKKLTYDNFYVVSTLEDTCGRDYDIIGIKDGNFYDINTEKEYDGYQYSNASYFHECYIYKNRNYACRNYDDSSNNYKFIKEGKVKLYFESDNKIIIIGSDNELVESETWKEPVIYESKVKSVLYNNSGSIKIILENGDEYEYEYEELIN